MVAGVDEHDLDRGRDPHGEVDEHRVGHRRGQRQVRAEAAARPLDDLGRVGLLEAAVELGELLVAELRGPEGSRRRLGRVVRVLVPRCEGGVAHQTAHSDSPISLVYGPVSP